jgi:hypothetical protein
MKKAYISILFLFLLFNDVKLQDINELPFTGILSSEELQERFDLYNDFSNRIYQDFKLESITSDGYTISNERWEPGTWGSGLFTQMVTRFEPGSNKYDEWFNTSAGGKYYGSHPQVRSTARRIIAYINKYNSGDSNLDYKNKIVDGLEYLVNIQYFQSNNDTHDGSFISIAYRKDKYTPNTDNTHYNTYPHEYPTGLALSALVEGYFFLEKLSIEPELKSRINSCVNEAGSWLMRRTESYNDNNVNGYFFNIKAFTLWGLCNAYELTQNRAYLNRAIHIYNIYFKDEQNPDGAWIYYPGIEHGDIGGIYHDTEPYYTGIILRALAKLHSILPQNAETSLINNIKNNISLSINHFLIPLDNPVTMNHRLDTNGRIKSYYKINATSAGEQLIQGLIYVFNSNIYSDSDNYKIRQFIDLLLKGSASYIASSADTDILNISLFYNIEKHNKYNALKDNMVLYSSLGNNTPSSDNLINTYEINQNIPTTTGNSNTGYPFQLMTTGDFDRDGKDEIALYRKFDGLVVVYEKDKPFTGEYQTGSISTGITNFDLMDRIDHDNDGFDELIFYSSNGDGTATGDHLINIYKLNNNTPIHSGCSNTGIAFNNISTGDFDRDGRNEIALMRRHDGLIVIYDPSKPYTGTYQVGSISTGINNFDLMDRIDYDNDGFDEIVLYSSVGDGTTSGDHLISIYKINNNFPIHSSNSNTGITFTQLSVGDFNFNGRDDIALYRETDGLIVIYNAHGPYTGNYQLGSVSTNLNNFICMSTIPSNSNNSNQSYEAFNLKSSQTTDNSFNIELFKFEIYPNPVNNILSISLGNESLVDRIQVVSLSGEILIDLPIRRFDSNNTIIDIDVNKLKNGVYSVILFQDNNLTCKKIIKL